MFFWGTSLAQKGILLNIQTRELFISRNVIFYESVFPYCKLEAKGSETNKGPSLNDENHNNYSPLFDPPIQNPIDISWHPTCEIDPAPQPSSVTTHPTSVAPSSRKGFDSPSTSEIDDSNEMNAITTPASSSTRIRRSPGYFMDYHCNISMMSNPSSKVLYPLSSVLSYEHLSPCYKSSLSSHAEPRNYTEALTYECWTDAIQAELCALDDNQTWIVTDLPKGKVPIGCKWIFNVKCRADETIERHKAHLVVKGYTQTEGLSRHFLTCD